jgi:hypothetical protein
MPNPHGYPRTKSWTKICRTCGQTFQASRVDARYDTGRCREYWRIHGRPYPGVPFQPGDGPGLFDGLTDTDAQSQAQTPANRKTTSPEAQQQPISPRPDLEVGVKKASTGRGRGSRPKAKSRQKPSGRSVKPKAKKKR